MWTPLTGVEHGVWTSAHLAGGGRGSADIAYPAGRIKAFGGRCGPLAGYPAERLRNVIDRAGAACFPAIARILHISRSVRVVSNDLEWEASHGRTGFAWSDRPGEGGRLVA